jgi:ribosome biogenesis GTPase / thiamine phosphate phosphatase
MKGDTFPTTGQLVGTVLAVQANFYRVQLESGVMRSQSVSGASHHSHPGGNPVLEKLQGKYFPLSPHVTTLLCTRRTRLKKIGQQVMVGDRVIIEEPDWTGGRGAITDVLARNSELDRPAIANVNQVLLVFAVADPPLEPFQLSRFLIKAESTDLDVILCLNKCDLITPEEQGEISDRLQGWGYKPIFISVQNNINIEEVSHYLNNKITVIAGSSGVGKSSLINMLIPDANLRVGEVSGKLARGRHTTRHVELFALPDGGLLADTPGFNQPDLNCLPEDLIYYFPEARKRLEVGNCRFSDCLHRDEPGCVVGSDWERYEHYLEFLNDAIAYQTYLKEQSDPESTLKVKTKGKGESKYEPKLESKKYRRVSRRFQVQSLQDLDLEGEE